MQTDWNKLFSTDNAKAAKASGYGCLNAIHYMAPGRSGGVGNLCPHMTDECEKACLGINAGRAAIVDSSGMSPVVRSRILKAQLFMNHRVMYMNQMARQIHRLGRVAAREDLDLIPRLNGSTDNAFERIKFPVDFGTSQLLGVPQGTMTTIYELFPHIQFDDYTKNFGRLGKAPANLHLVFSFSGRNHEECKAALAGGHSIAVVFGHGLPDMWWGHPVINGDLHDLRHLDPANVVVGLKPKGKVAKASTSSFIIRDY